jgi:hypothetical protein
MYETKANTDLASNEGDQAYLQSQYPRIADILIWPELVDAFRQHEDEARRLKSGSRRNSFWSIGFIVLSLTTTLIGNSAAFAPLVSAHPSSAYFVAGVSFLLFVLALLFGNGILYGRKRDDWLKHRLIAERLRHFYFQTILGNLDATCSGNVLGKRRFIEDRGRALERVLRRLRSPGYRQAVLGDEALQEARLVDFGEVNIKDIDVECFEELEAYWVELRFNWQGEYATQQLARKVSALPLSGSLADKEYSVSKIEFIATAGIIALQSLALTGTFFAGPTSPIVEVSVLGGSVLAILVVGLQAYKDGLGLSEDLSRNRVYASYIAKLVRDFASAQKKTDRAAQVRIMQEMEDLAYFETREFLYTHSTTRFSL